MIIVRRVLPNDAYGFALCKNKSWQSAYRGIVPAEYLEGLSAEKQSEWVRKWITEQKESEFYCVTKDDEIIGVLVVNPCRDEDRPDSGELTAIYLLEEYWDKGYGREMMDFAINALNQMGFDEIIVWVLEENSRARRFYEKFNFVFDGTMKEIEIGKPLVEIRYVRGAGA